VCSVLSNWHLLFSTMSLVTFLQQLLLVPLPC
jgi:hypothetical protein